MCFTAIQSDGRIYGNEVVACGAFEFGHYDRYATELFRNPVDAGLTLR